MSFSFQGLILIVSFCVGAIPFELMFFRDVETSKKPLKALASLFVLNALKGMLPVLVLLYTGLPLILAAAVGLPDDGLSLVTPLLVWAVGFCSVAGHCANLFYKLGISLGNRLGKNSKGMNAIAPALGVFSVLAPWAALIGVLSFCFSYLKTKSPSLGGLVGVSLGIVSYVVMNPIHAHVFLAAAICFVVLIRYEESIDLLLKGDGTA